MSEEKARPGLTEGGRVRSIVVAIAGGSATGKSTLARALAAELTELRPVILGQDRYFRDFMELSPEEREQVHTANSSNALHWGAFHAALDALRAGEAIVEPVAGTRPFHRGDEPRTLGPAGLVLVEGLFALWDEHTRAVADLRLYTEVDDDERVLRRIYRDVTERGGTVERIVAWYRRDVKPNYPTYTAATRRFADLIVPTDRPNPTAIRALADAIRGLA
ncbi:MAG: uridine kinase family protein, partial [Chloroflexota bacterium]